MARHSSFLQEMEITGSGCYRPVGDLKTYHVAIKSWMKINGMRNGDKFVLELHLPRRLQASRL